MRRYQTSVTVKPWQGKLNESDNLDELDEIFCMAEADEQGLEAVMGVFEQRALERGIIEAYTALTIPETRKATIQIITKDKDGKDTVKGSIRQGKVKGFDTAKIEGYSKTFPNIHIAIWHPTSCIVFLDHKKCKPPMSCEDFDDEIRRCKGLVYEAGEEKLICSFRSYSLGWMTLKKEAKNKHQQHLQELKGAIREFRPYLPKLREMEIKQQLW